MDEIKIADMNASYLVWTPAELVESYNRIALILAQNDIDVYDLTTAAGALTLFFMGAVVNTSDPNPETVMKNIRNMFEYLVKDFDIERAIHHKQEAIRQSASDAPTKR